MAELTRQEFINIIEKNGVKGAAKLLGATTYTIYNTAKRHNIVVNEIIKRKIGPRPKIVIID
jgi:hypothetical protein